MRKHPKLVGDWTGLYRVSEVSDNSAVVTRIFRNSGPIRIEFDSLGIVHKEISDELVETVHCRGRKGRPPKVKIRGAYSDCSRGAVLLSPADKGHLPFQCVDDCFQKTTLKDIEGIQFPGACGNQPFGDPWTAWKTACIDFYTKGAQHDEEVEFFRNRAVSLDAEALGKVPVVAYSVCTEWTEFICTTRGIAKHEPIEQNCIVGFYRVELEDLKKELQKDEREARSSS
ncbi:hypothetical protein V3C99_012192, partial [Haemonchus contortus]|uniref:DUF3598 domain-containing protein n=1 Tax=Haemonchus contortus TaxID=6289 RepID=A0A7I5E7C6_HAECO